MHENIGLNYHDTDLVFKHLVRYAFAMKYCRERRVIDIGCGQGYGSWILSNQAAEVLAIDRRESFDPKYRVSGIRFVISDWFSPGLDAVFSGLYDMPTTFVAMECLEHMDTPQYALALTWGRMRVGDLLVGSLPINQGTVAYHVCGDKTWNEWMSFTRLVGEPSLELHQTNDGWVRDYDGVSEDGYYLFVLEKKE